MTAPLDPIVQQAQGAGAEVVLARVEPSPTRRARGVSMSTRRLAVGDTMVTRGPPRSNRDPCKLLILLEPASGLEPLTC